MTGHPDQPDVAQRRRITRLRADLGLTPVPPYVGSELRSIAPLVSERVAGRLGSAATYEALSLDGQRQLLSAVARAVDEFARLVEDRPPGAPAVEIMLVEVVRIEGPVEPCRAALHVAFRTVREVVRELWTQLPHAQSFSTQLDIALARYAERLCARTMNARSAPTAGQTEQRRPGEAHLDGLLALVANRWGTAPVPLYLSVSTLGAADVPLPQLRPPRDTTRPLRLVTTDHVVMITQHPVPPPRTAGAVRRPVVVCAGPVDVGDIALVHDTALLLLRLIGAGVAAPPSPVVLPVPNLGFLHPYPSEASVRKIADLLHPLTGQGSQRRTALARTLQLRLRTAGTAQGLARQLEMHPQTVHNHLAALRRLYNADLGFADETLAMQAALDLVLPLWELEAAARRAPSAPDGRKLVENDSGPGRLPLP